jgi:hypothetical protein
MKKEAAMTRAEQIETARDRALVRAAVERTAGFITRKEDMVALHVCGSGLDEIIAAVDATHPRPEPAPELREWARRLVRSLIGRHEGGLNPADYETAFAEAGPPPGDLMLRRALARLYGANPGPYPGGCYSDCTGETHEPRCVEWSAACEQARDALDAGPPPSPLASDVGLAIAEEAFSQGWDARARGQRTSDLAAIVAKHCPREGAAAVERALRPIAVATDALLAAGEEGRRAGLEAAAQVCDARSDSAQARFEKTGDVSEALVSSTFAAAADAVRTLASAPPSPLASDSGVREEEWTATYEQLRRERAAYDLRRAALAWAKYHECVDEDARNNDPDATDEKLMRAAVDLVAKHCARDGAVPKGAK